MEPEGIVQTTRIYQGRFWHDPHPDDILISGNYQGDIVISDGDRVICKVSAGDDGPEERML